VPAAPHADPHAVLPAARHGGLDVGGLRRGDDVQWLRRLVRVELEVPDGGRPDGAVRRRAPGVEEPRGDALGEAREEVTFGGRGGGHGRRWVGNGGVAGG